MRSSFFIALSLCFYAVLRVVVVGERVEDLTVDRFGRFLQDRDITSEELSQHYCLFGAGGLWTALDGIVYDVTDYIHEGGPVGMARAGGIDSTDLYFQFFPDHHYLQLDAVVLQPGFRRLGPLVSTPTIPIFERPRCPQPPPTESPTVRPTVTPSVLPTSSPSHPENPTMMPSPKIEAPPTATDELPTMSPVEPLIFIPTLPSPEPLPPSSAPRRFAFPLNFVIGLLLGQALFVLPLL